MIEILRDLLATITPGAILAAGIFGVAAGMTYGWRASSTEGRRDAVLLFWVVLGFFVMRAVLSLITGAPIGLGRSLGGIALWLVTCWALVVGQELRRRLEAWRQKRELARARQRAEPPVE